MDVRWMNDVYLTVDTDIVSGDSEDMMVLKEAVNMLPPADKIIFLLYVEYGSLRKVGEKLGVSHTTIFKQIRQIKKMLFEYVEREYPENNDLLNEMKKCCI
jgi:TyrR family helix-turn-helix protein